MGMFRTPSLKRSISARTTGRVKKSVKKAVVPFYGSSTKRLLTDPVGKLEDYAYKQTTISLNPLSKDFLKIPGLFGATRLTENCFENIIKGVVSTENLNEKTELTASEKNEVLKLMVIELFPETAEYPELEKKFLRVMKDATKYETDIEDVENEINEIIENYEGNKEFEALLEERDELYKWYSEKIDELYEWYSEKMEELEQEFNDKLEDLDDRIEDSL